MYFKIALALTLIQTASAELNDIFDFEWFSRKVSYGNEGKFSLIVSKEGEIPYCIHNIYECNLENVLDNLFQGKNSNSRNVYFKGQKPLNTLSGTPEHIYVANQLSLDYYYSNERRSSIGIGFYLDSGIGSPKTIIHILKPKTAEQLFHQHHIKSSDTPGFRRLI